MKVLERVHRTLSLAELDQILRKHFNVKEDHSTWQLSAFDNAANPNDVICVFTTESKEESKAVV